MKPRPFAMAALALFASFLPSHAQEPAPNSQGLRRALILCGLPGDVEHRTLYADVVEKLSKSLVDRCGFATEDIWVRFGDESEKGDGPALERSRGLSNREGIAADVQAIRQRSKPEDALWVITLGHGHFDGRRAHLNIPGPDLSDVAFGRLFEGIAAKEQVFILTTSVSGFFLKPLAKTGRVVISATEADQEVNETLFPQSLADVLSGPLPESDRDKDGSLSVFELYLATVANVMARYIEDELIATEHAQLDDNGDGRGSEVQMTFLPPEVLAETEAEKSIKADQGTDKTKKKAEPKLGPKDDGFLASKVRVDRPPLPKKEEPK